MWQDLKRRLTPAPLPTPTTQHYSSLDSWETVTAVYQEHLLSRGRRVPRALKWLFIVLVPVTVGLVGDLLRQTLQLLNRLELRELLEPIDRKLPDDPAGAAAICAAVLAAIAAVLFTASALLSRFFGTTTTGRGLPSVVGYLNGVAMPQWGEWRLVAVKILTTVLTTASGVPMGQFGILVEIGAMIGAMTLVRNRVTLHFDFLKHFRNPRDKRLIVNVGLAAGVTAAFQSPMGGLLVVLELLTSRFPVKFAAYVFTGCVICAFTVQVMSTYFDGFSLRSRGGLPKTQLDPMSEQIQVELNYALVLPTIVIALICSVAAAGYVVAVNWLGRLFHDAHDRRPSRNLIVAAVGMAAVYNVITVLLSYTFGGTHCVVPPRSAYEFEAPPYGTTNESLPDAAIAAPVHTVSLGLTTNLFCANKTGTTIFGTAEQYPINTFASLALSFPEQAFRLVIQREFSLDPAAIGAYLPVLFVGSCFFSALLNVVNGDTLLPCAIMGGCIGHLVYAAQLHIPGLDVAWLNSGVYGLVGAAAFLSAVNHMTFSLVFLLVDVSGDVRHVLFVMLAVAVARFVTRHALKLDSLEHSILRIMACPLLDFADRIATRDDLSLHRFQAPHGRLVILRSTESVAFLLKTLSETTHNAFPLVGPDGRSLIGVVHRTMIELLLWRVTDVPPQRLRAKRRPAGTGVDTSPPPAATAGDSGRWVPTTLAPRAEGVTLASHFESVAVPPPSSASRGGTRGNATPNYSGGLTVPGGVPAMDSFSQLGQRAPELVHGAGGAAGLDEYDALRDLETWIARCRLEFPDPAPAASPLDGAAAPSKAKDERPKALPTLEAAFDAGPFDALAHRINLARYADRSPFIVRVEASAGRAYQLFNVLGARHLILVDFKGQPRGILTRLDLLREVFKGKRREERLSQEQQILVPSDSERSYSPPGAGPMGADDGDGAAAPAVPLAETLVAADDDGDDGEKSPTTAALAPAGAAADAATSAVAMVPHVETDWNVNAFASQSLGPASFRGHSAAVSVPTSPRTAGNASFQSCRVTERPALLMSTRSAPATNDASPDGRRTGRASASATPRRTSAHISLRSARRSAEEEPPADPAREMSLRAVESIGDAEAPGPSPPEAAKTRDGSPEEQTKSAGAPNPEPAPAPTSDLGTSVASQDESSKASLN